MDLVTEALATLFDTQIHIRPLTVDDQEFLWEILYTALWDLPTMPPRARSVLENPAIAVYARDWGTGTHDLGFVVVNNEDIPIGAVWMRLLTPPLIGGSYLDEETPQLGIALLPRWQGQGIGKRLLRHHLHVARGLVPRISLSVHPENTRAIHLYTECGFKQFGVGLGDYLQMVVEIEQEQLSTEGK